MRYLLTITCIATATSAGATQGEPSGMTAMERELQTTARELAVQKEQRPARSRQRPAVSLSGPRIGVTYVLGEEARLLRDRLDINPIMTQFGWQFEHRFFEQPGGFSGVNEFIFLLGGLDQASILPSVSWIIGVRSNGGIEAGAGPVIALTPMIAAMKDGTFGLGEGRSLAGIGFAVAAGVTIRSEDVNFPINLALVRSDTGLRLSLLAGFNLQSDDEVDEEKSKIRSRVHEPERGAALPLQGTTGYRRTRRGKASPVAVGTEGGITAPTEAAGVLPRHNSSSQASLSQATVQELVDLSQQDSTSAMRVVDELRSRKTTVPLGELELTPAYVGVLAHDSKDVSAAALRVLLASPRAPETLMRALIGQAVVAADSEATAEQLYRYLVRWNPPGLKDIQRRVVDLEHVSAKIRRHARVSIGRDPNP